MKKYKDVLLFKREILATILIIIVVIVLTSCSLLKIYAMEEQRCWRELEKNANEVSDSIASHIYEDQQVLSILADVIADNDAITNDELIKFVNSFTPRTASSYIAVLLPDNRIILPGGIHENSKLSFEKISALGVHTSDRLTDVSDDNTFVVHNYVPIIKDNETIAILIGVIDLQSLSDNYNYSAYGGEASLFVFDGPDGNDLINTWHDTLGNAYERGARPVKKGFDYDKMQKESLAGETGYIIFSSQSSGEYLYYYYRNVDINNWSMALSVRESIVFKDAWAARKVLIIFVASEALAFLLYLAWVLWNVKKTMQKERKQNIILEEALERAENAGKAKSMFLSSMSHDIRTPMNAIIGFTAIANTHIDEKERVQDCLNKITSSGNHLLALINDVLIMSKIESGDIQLNEQEHNIAEIFHNFTNIIQSQISAKDLELFIDNIGVEHEYVYIDTLRFNQILLNIVGNAIKYTEPGGTVTVQIDEQPCGTEEYSNYIITVKDTGVGISEEYLPNIFESFTREQSSTISRIEGTGLGLSITKRIVSIMGGTISVESELGKGSQFTISIPLKTKEAPALPVNYLEGKKLLIADNNLQVCENISKMLAKIGAKPDWATSGKEAILKANNAENNNEPYFAYIINWELPGINANDLIKQIRNASGVSPFILITTPYDYFSIEDEAIKAGATAFTQKPLFISDLKNILNRSYKLGKNEEQYETDNSNNRFKGKRILLVEDNELNREIAVEILKVSNFIVETAVNGQIALNMLEASKPGYYDAILMDIQMPVMDGHQATREIRKLSNKELASVPIIAMTANAFDEDKQEAFENGMDGHIAKPFDPDLMIETLVKLIH